MIKVTVVAPYAVKGANAGGGVELPEQATVARMLRQTRAPLFAFALPVFVNGTQANLRTRLKDSDTVVVVMPISGG